VPIIDLINQGRSLKMYPSAPDWLLHRNRLSKTVVILKSTFSSHLRNEMSKPMLYCSC